MSTCAAPRPSASLTVDMALLSERIVVAIDQYAALSEAVLTAKPVEMRLCVVSSALLVARRVWSAVIADALVLMLAIGKNAPHMRLDTGTYRAYPVWRDGIMPLE